MRKVMDTLASQPSPKSPRCHHLIAGAPHVPRPIRALPHENSPVPPWDVPVPGLSSQSPCRLVPPPTDASLSLCHLADLLQGPPKGMLCSCYLSRVKQCLALSLWYSTSCASTTVCGDAQKTKPVNRSLLKITLWNKKRLNPDLFTEGLMPPLYLCRARTRLSQHRDLHSISLPADNNPTHPFCLPWEHPNYQVQLPISPGKALPLHVKCSFLHSAIEN